MTVALIPVAFGYGTTIRCLAIARELERRGHRSVFLAGSPVHPLICRYGFPVRSIPDVSIRPDPHEPPVRQLFAQESAAGFLARQLDAIVRALLAIRADLVIYSDSLTAALAASHLGLPSISIVAPSILAISAPTLLLPMLRTWLQFLLLRARTVQTRPVPCAFVGDRTFIPSIPPLIRWPALIPPGLARARGSLEPCGALLTQRPDDLLPRGALLEELEIDQAPFVYATVGGAILRADLLAAIAEGIRRTGSRGIVSGGRLVSPAIATQLSDRQVRVVPYLPNDLRAIKAADALIWHGGHQTMMEAVACGTPAIGIPVQLDQFANVDALARFGAALALSPKALRANEVACAVEQVLGNPRFRARVAILREINQSYRGATAVADAAELLLLAHGIVRAT